MTKGQMDKANFVMDYVQPMLCDMDPRISSVVYSVDDRGNELVTVRWDDNGRLKDAVNVNVTCDSKAALVYDIIKIIFL